MTISKVDLNNFAESFNLANTQDTVPMQNNAKDGASIVFGAMNGYLWLLVKDNPEFSNSEEYKTIKNTFQDIMDWFISDWDIEEWKEVKGRGKGRIKIELEPKDKK